jgi:hypothetical protein
MSYRLDGILTDDAAWSRFVEDVGVRAAIDEVMDQKRGLKLQRAERHPSVTGGASSHRSFTAWVNKQAQFERHLDRRLRALTLTNRDYLQVLARLAYAIDGNDGDVVLDEVEVTFGTETMTLAEAIDSGQLKRPTDM